MSERWTVFKFGEQIGGRYIIGPDTPDDGVEVMPVAEHEARVAELEAGIAFALSDHGTYQDLIDRLQTLSPPEDKPCPTCGWPSRRPGPEYHEGEVRCPDPFHPPEDKP